jgi:hypothetical protein
VKRSFWNRNLTRRQAFVACFIVVWIAGIVVVEVGDYQQTHQRSSLVDATLSALFTTVMMALLVLGAIYASRGLRRVLFRKGAARPPDEQQWQSPHPVLASMALSGEDASVKATERVRSALLGEEIHSVFLGGWWSISFSNRLWLQFQDVVCPGEDRINKLLAQAEPDVLARDDPNVVKSLLLASYMRRPITGCSVASNGTLSLEFGQGRVVRFPTDADIVDWQWWLGPIGSEPYIGPLLVACLWSGELTIEDE